MRRLITSLLTLLLVIVLTFFLMQIVPGGPFLGENVNPEVTQKLLEKYGFLIYELLTPDDIQRDIIDKAGADMKAFEHVNYCLAVREY